MKRLYALLTSLCLVFCLVGCSNSAETNTAETNSVAETKITYEDAVTNYMDVYRQGKVEKLEQLAPQEVIDNLRQNRNMDIEERREIVKKEAADLEETVKETYGEDMKFTVTVNKKETVDNEEFEFVSSLITGLYKIPKEDIKEIAIAHFDVTFSGNGKEKTSNTRMMVVNIRDNWYACNNEAEFGVSHNMLYY